MSDPDEQLRRLLGADPPDSVLALDLESRTALAGLLQDSRTRQSASLEESFAATLKHVPFPVRGIVKKVLLG
jgi:hypothetical protein